MIKKPYLESCIRTLITGLENGGTHGYLMLSVPGLPSDLTLFAHWEVAADASAGERERVLEVMEAHDPSQCHRARSTKPADVVTLVNWVANRLLRECGNAEQLQARVQICNHDGREADEYSFAMSFT
jgi:hypothetical protein